MILTNLTIKSFKFAVMIATLVGSVSWAQDEEGRKDQSAHRAAFEACREELGIEKPEKGQRPQAMDESIRTQLDECMKEKGFEAPKFGRGGPSRGEGEAGVR